MQPHSGKKLYFLLCYFFTKKYENYHFLAFTKAALRRILCSMETVKYNRLEAVRYAKKWAFSRNPAYYDFQNLGGDCTNFALQCLFAGAKIENLTPDVGWYYRSLDDRAAAWTGVEYFRNFLVWNKEGVGNGDGPFAKEVPLNEIEIGDFLQFGTLSGDFYHTPVVVGFFRGQPLLAAHTNDAFNRPLNSYRFQKLRCLHILGVRKP